MSLTRFDLCSWAWEVAFPFEHKHHSPKKEPIGDLILLDTERCVICARCVRFQDEIVGDPVLAIEERGRSARIVSYSSPQFDSKYSGNTADICPVGALTTRDFRFGARAWKSPMSLVSVTIPQWELTRFWEREPVKSNGLCRAKTN